MAKENSSQKHHFRWMENQHKKSLILLILQKRRRKNAEVFLLSLLWQKILSKKFVAYPGRAARIMMINIMVERINSGIQQNFIQKSRYFFADQFWTSHISIKAFSLALIFETIVSSKLAQKIAFNAWKPRPIYSLGFRKTRICNSLRRREAHLSRGPHI